MFAGVVALGAIGDARAVESLEARLADESDEVCRVAAEALGLIGDARAVSWSNRSARIAFPEQALRACVACLRAG